MFLILTDEEVQCDSCEMIFTIIFNRNPVYDQPELCPFCGEDA